MECKDLIKKFEDIDGWTKTDDGREAFTKNFSNFLILNKLFLL